MKHLHYTVNAGPSDCIRVELNKQANVKLMDSINYQRYRSGGRYSFQGGLAKSSPALFTPPSYKNWHVVIDLGGYAGSVQARVSVA
ncbi:MAG: DUF1883 domain-containing protein [Cyanobacteria bacterium J06638_20]